MVQTIMVVEDDQDLRKYLKDILVDNGYSVVTASDGPEALKKLEKSAPDLIVLDLGLPTLRGETVCSETKKLFPTLPIIILTAKDATSDLVKGFNLGADDYMTKPFETDELLARIQSHLRSRSNLETKIKIANLELDSGTMEVTRDSKKIKLTPQEFKLLSYLMSNVGKVLTRDMILNRLWLYADNIESRVVDVYVGYLRKKIDGGFKKKLIHTMRGFGYVIKE